jgi:hypothetical protein
MKLPPLEKYHRAQDFFRDFYELNQPNITYRSFAAEIGWPASLLCDMVHGLKVLAVERAIEFASAMNLNSVQQARLIMLALKEVRNIDVQEYAINYLETEGAQLKLGEGLQIDTDQVIKEETYGNVEYMVLYSFLTWSKGEISLEALPSYLPCFPAFRNRAFILELLSEMRAEGLIEGDAPNVKVLKKHLISTKPNPVSKKSYLNSFSRITELSPEKVRWSAGTVIFPKKRLSELIEKRNALRDWILTTSTREEPTAKTDPNKHTILQIALLICEILEGSSTLENIPSEVKNMT